MSFDANPSPKETGSFSPETSAFFATIKDNPALQKRLYDTKELSDVAVIANEAGFKVSGADILRAQANRTLSLPADQQAVIAQGRKPQSGAQWGRDGGNGYLDNAGYWMVTFIDWGYIGTTLTSVIQAIQTHPSLRLKLSSAKIFNDVADVLNAHGYDVSAISLLQHQAQLIGELTPEQAEQVARGQI